MTSFQHYCHIYEKTTKDRQLSLKFLAARFRKDLFSRSETILNAVHSMNNVCILLLCNGKYRLLFNQNLSAQTRGRKERGYK